MTVLFMDIPRTAETALRVAIEGAVPEAQRVYVYEPSHMPSAITIEALAEMDDEQKRSLRVVMGHFQYGIHRALPQETRYVTMLCEPVDRLISMYSFYQRDFPELVGDKALEEWATSGETVQTDNEMARRMAGRLEMKFGTLTSAVLGEAIEHMDRDFAAVMLTEELNVSYGILSGILGAELPAPGTKNAAPDRPSISDELRTRLADLNRFDVALYEYAKYRFSSVARAA